MNSPIESKEIYSNHVNQTTPNSKMTSNIFKAFLIGGLICTIGQFLQYLFISKGLDKQTASTLVSVILIFLGSFLTGINVYSSIGKFAGAGSIVPITGFANSIVSPAMEYKSDGYVMGVGSKMFLVAGPVLVFGTIASIIYGLIYYLSISNI